VESTSDIIPENMSQRFDRPPGRRIVIKAPSGRHRPAPRKIKRPALSPRTEALVAAGVIGAAALATFLALFITSRPFDPMNSSVSADQTVPPSVTYLQPSPRPTPSMQPSPTPRSVTLGGIAPEIPDDRAIQAEIEKRIAEDPVLADLDVSTLVEAGKVTLAGAVKSPELKSRIERLVRAIRGVTSIDDQLAVMQSTPPEL
jgi:hypothetical protein